MFFRGVGSGWCSPKRPQRKLRLRNTTFRKESPAPPVGARYHREPIKTKDVRVGKTAEIRSVSLT